MRTLFNAFKCIGANVLHNYRAGDSATFVGYLPTPGVKTINLFCAFYIANATDVTITVKTADDAAGTNAAVLTENVPMWIQESRLSDGKSLTLAVATYGATANYTAIIQIPAIIVPASKYLGCYLTAGHTNNKLTVVAFENTFYSR